MKAIAAVNTVLPSLAEGINYYSGASLRDYDITIFDPSFPTLQYQDFSGGGYAINIDSTQELRKALAHWDGELRGALQSGKTVFILLSQMVTESAAVSYSLGTGGRRSYRTTEISNYSVLPVQLKAKNAKGRHIVVADSRFRPLLETLGDAASYQVILEGNAGAPIYSTKDKATVGAIMKVTGASGHLVLLPYFNFEEYDTNAQRWGKETLQKAKALIAHIVAIDALLTKGAAETPPPEWMSTMPVPVAVSTIDAQIAVVDSEIERLARAREVHLGEKARLISYARLLYENGKSLEAAVYDALTLIGFDVENYRSGDLEIDHIITGPSGIRMIGESEGKDTSAVDISKFRQLETNINEDFQREEVSEPAKGVLFANGYRFTLPGDRPDQFTGKCVTNAKRLGTALVRTSDLYGVAIHLLDHPEDEAFKARCRHAIEQARGEVVVFPSPAAA